MRGDHWANRPARANLYDHIYAPLRKRSDATAVRGRLAHISKPASRLMRLIGLHHPAGAAAHQRYGRWPELDARERRVEIGFRGGALAQGSHRAAFPAQAPQSVHRLRALRRAYIFLA